MKLSIAGAACAIIFASACSAPVRNVVAAGGGTIPDAAVELPSESAYEPIPQSYAVAARNTSVRDCWLEVDTDGVARTYCAAHGLETAR